MLLMEAIRNKRIIRGTIWKAIEVVFQKGSSLIIQIIMARLLAPEYFGVVGIAIIFVNFADIFVNNGLNIAIVRKEKLEENDIATALIMAVGTVGIIYVVFFVLAPIIADIYNEPSLISVIRVLLLAIFPKSIGAIIKARANRNLEMKKISLCSIVSNICGGVIGIILVLMGARVWALVFQHILVAIIECVLLLIAFKWCNAIKFSIDSFKSLSSFCRNSVLAGLVEFCGTNCSTVIVGSVYNITDIGYLRKGASIPEAIGGAVANTSSAIILPVLSTKQNDDRALYSAYRRTIYMSLVVLFPCMVCIAAVAKEFVTLFLTEKWLPIVSIIRWFAIIYGINIIRTIDVTMLYARGKSKIVFIAELFRSTVSIITNLALVIWFNVSFDEYVIYSSAITIGTILIFHFFVEYNTSGKISELSIPVFKIGGICAFAYGVVGTLDSVVESCFMLLIIKGCLFIGMYIVVLLLFEKSIRQEIILKFGRKKI